MIPYVFVSSTVQDLQHLRDAVRETVEQLGYLPVMSEHGEIGYMSRGNAEESCYHTIKDCQLAIVLIGKRYGNLSENGLSVTHNEFLSAREHSVRTITLLDQDVVTFKRVFDAQAEGERPRCFPDMDAPEKTFQFIQNISDSEVSNAILPFSHTTQARDLLRKQFAHLFGDFLRDRFAPVKSDVKDVLAELRTLRHEFKDKRPSDPDFIIAMRFLIADEHDSYRHFIEWSYGPIDKAIPQLVAAVSFQEFTKEAGVELKVVSDAEFQEYSHKQEGVQYRSSQIYNPIRDGERVDLRATIVYFASKRAILNHDAKEMFEMEHREFLRAIGK